MERYPEHRIVPYSIGKSIIKGLQVRYLNDEDCSISKALFNQRLDEENILTLSRGNENYGFDSWKI